jgi:hypothetical protein
LALLELHAGLTPAELAGGYGLATARPLTRRIEGSFTVQLRALPPRTRELLLLAAADPVGDPTLLWKAAERLGLGVDDAIPAEEAELITIDTRVQFRHPLVRSAIYRVATLSNRRRTHQALAEAIDPRSDAAGPPRPRRIARQARCGSAGRRGRVADRCRGGGHR